MSGAVTAAVVGGAAYGLGATAATAVAVGLGAGTLKAQNDNAKESLENQKKARTKNNENICESIRYCYTFASLTHKL